MLRAMVFIDFENFSIAKYKYYKQLSTENSINGTEVIVPNPKISFVELSWKLVKMLPQAHTLMKTFLFVPKPDGFVNKCAVSNHQKLSSTYQAAELSA